AADLDAQSRGERQFDPGRVLPGCQAIAFALDSEFRPPAALHAEAEWDFHRERFFVQTIGRTLYGAPARCPVSHQRSAVAALHLRAAGSRGVQRERTLRAQQVRRTHGGGDAAIELLGRKGDGHTNYGGCDLALPEDLPEGLTLAPHFNDWATQRNAIPA